MTDFYSDFLTYLTGACVGAAALAIGIPAAQPDGNMVASAQPDITLIRDIATAAGVDPAGGDVSEIPRAELIPVKFNPSGIEASGSALAITPEIRTGVVTADAVNLRAGPGTSNEIIGRGLRDETYELTGEKDGIWLQISGNALSGTAWVHGDYLDTTQ